MLLKQNEHLDARAAHGSAASRSTDETHWWTYDGVYSEKKGRGGVRSLFFFFFARQVSRGDGNLSERKTGRKRNVWKLGAAHEQQPKMHKLLEGGGISGWGRGGRDEGGAGSGPVTVGGAAEGLTAGCCVVEEETACCSGQRYGGWWWWWWGGQQQQRGPFRLLHIPGIKESEGVRLTSSVFAYPPLSHRLFARLFRGLLPVLQIVTSIAWFF